MLFAPELDERVLHNVLGIGDRLHELAGKENEAGRGFGKTNLPIFISGDILHDLPKGLSLSRRRQLAILSNFGRILPTASTRKCPCSRAAPSPLSLSAL